MKVWNTKQHERILREKKEKKLRTQKPEHVYDTSYHGGNSSNGLTTKMDWYSTNSRC